MYPTFGSIAAAKHAFRRCRKTQWFILTDEGAAREDPPCKVCGKRLSEDRADPGYRGKRLSEDRADPGYRGNRCIYHPKTWLIVPHDVPA